MVINVEKSINMTKYSLQRIAGRNIIEQRPVFSPDGESLAIIVENIVRVYNIRTGEIVRTLETESNVGELLAIEFPDNEDYNLVGCSVDGCVTIWTWDNGAVLREISLQIPPQSRIVTFNLINNNECFITARGGSAYSKNIHMGAYSVKTGYLLHEYKNYGIWNTNMIKVAMGCCNEDKFAAIINGTKTLYIQSIHQPHMYNLIKNSGEFRITSVAAHHNMGAVAITDTLGRVNIIRGHLFDRTSSSIAKEILHWHFLPPLAVCFSIQGNYLYSGGMEAVLVKWTLGNLAYKANEKAFIPRLPGLVRYVTTNNTHIAITLSNNSVVLVNVQMRVVSTILECGGVSPLVRAVGSTFLYHPQFGALLMHSRTGHLQLYSTHSNKILYDVDITDVNSIQPERWNLLPLETEITCANLSPNGATLVTSEYRNDGIMYPEEKLKFWSTQKSNQNTPFKLNTCVNLSHGGCRVVSIALNHAGNMCVTAGTDQKFRMWKQENIDKSISWFCLTACYYSSGPTQALSQSSLNDYKLGEISDRFSLPYMKEISRDDVISKVMNLHTDSTLVDFNSLSSGMIPSEHELGGVAVSRDGSLVAAWFGCKLTLWDTHLCSMRTTLSHPALRPKGLHVEFGNKDAAHYLVCTTENCLAVWSLLSLTIKWLVQIQPVCLTSDVLSNKMAVVTTNNDVYVFSPHNSVPILIQKTVLDPQKGILKQCAFGTTSPNDIRLYLMRNNAEIYSIEPEQGKEGRLEVISHRNEPKSKFSALIAEQQLSEVRSVEPVGSLTTSSSNATASAAISQISQAPPHMIPPVSLLCTSFLHELSGLHNSKDDDDSVVEDPIDATDSSDEDETEGAKLNGSYAPKVTELWTANYEAIKEKKLNKIMKEPFLDLHASGLLFGVQ